MKSLNLRLFTHGVSYVAARMVPQAIGFLMLPIYAIYLGKEGYGALSLVTTVGAVTSLVLAQGQSSSQFRLRFRYQGDQRRTLQTTIFWYTVFSMAAGLLLFAWVGPLVVRRYLREVEFYPLLYTAVAAACLNSITEQYLRTLQAAQKPRAFLIQSVSKTLLNSGLAALLVVGFHWGVEGRIFADFAAAVVFVVIASIRLRPKAPWRSSFAMLRESLSFGFPLMWGQAANWVNNLSDRILVASIAGLAPAGLYSMAYKIASVASVVGTSLSIALNAQMYRTLNTVEEAPNEEKKRNEALIRGAARSQLIQVTMVAIGLGCLAKETLIVMSKGQFAQSADIVPLILGGIVVWAAYQPFTGVLAYFGRARVIPFFSGSAAAVNVGLNLLMIPRLGIAGAALATLLSNSVAFTMGYVISRRVFTVYPKGTLPRLLFRCGLVLGAIATIDQLDFRWYCALPAKLVVTSLAALWIASLMNLTPRKVLGIAKQLVRERLGSESK